MNEPVDAVLRDLGSQGMLIQLSLSPHLTLKLPLRNIAFRETLDVTSAF